MSLLKYSIFLFSLMLASCQPDQNVEKANLSSTYVLILADTSTQVPPWLINYRKSSLKNNKIVVSGYPAETHNELLARLPWLLQPGVDTLIIDRNFVDDHRAICDSIALWSPTTHCKSMLGS